MACKYSINPCRGEPVCSPVVWADTQVCPYKMTHDGRNMEQVYQCVAAQVKFF